jgi:hypothetical protein
LVWSTDQKSIYLSSFDRGTSFNLWKENVEGSDPEKVTEDCGWPYDIEPGGRYLFSLMTGGEKVGIYQWSIPDKKCTPLEPGVVTFGVLSARDGESFTYAIPSRHDVTVYRQNWQAGRLFGRPQVALKLPFAFPLVSGGNGYDMARDLSIVVYARPGGHADLYRLSQK